MRKLHTLHMQWNHKISVMGYKILKSIFAFFLICIFRKLFEDTLNHLSGQTLASTTARISVACENCYFVSQDPFFLVLFIKP